MHWYVDGWRNYADFLGRARRMEYWTFVLINSVVFAVIALIAIATRSWGVWVLAGLFGLALIIPWVSVTVRRLHDTGRSGWYYLIGFIPVVGEIWLLVLLLLDSEPGPNLYGASPKAPAYAVRPA
jgi:uncharacterized membrane protein YhaH (DUF805 family)